MVDDLNDRGEKDPKAVDVSPVPELLDAAQYSGVAGQSKQSVSGHFFGQAPYFTLGELYRRGRLVEDLKRAQLSIPAGNAMTLCEMPLRRSAPTSVSEFREALANESWVLPHMQDRPNDSHIRERAVLGHDRWPAGNLSACGLTVVGHATASPLFVSLANYVSSLLFTLGKRHETRKARSLTGALFSLVCLTFVASLLAIEDSVCGSALNAAKLCRVIPENWIPGLATCAVLGLLWSAHKAYRDFHLGEYWFERDE